MTNATIIGIVSSRRLSNIEKLHEFIKLYSR